MRQTLGRIPEQAVTARRQAAALAAACGIGGTLSFGWTATESAVIYLWPAFILVRIFATLVVYAFLPMFAARRVKRLYPHGIGLRPVILASITIVLAIVIGREMVFEVLRRLVPHEPISILAPYSLFEPLLPPIIFYFTTRSFQEGAEFSARSDLFERYGPMR